MLRDDVERGEYGPVMPEHILVPGALLLMSIAFVFGIALGIPNKSTRLAARVASFVPPVVAYVMLRPPSFGASMSTQLSTSQWIGFLRRWRWRSSTRSQADEARKQPEGAMSPETLGPGAATELAREAGVAKGEERGDEEESEEADESGEDAEAALTVTKAEAPSPKKRERTSDEGESASDADSVREARARRVSGGTVRRSSRRSRALVVAAIVAAAALASTRALAADRVAVLRFYPSGGGATNAQLDAARAATRDAVGLLHDLPPSDAELAAAEASVRDGTPDTSAEYRIAGQVAGAQWTVAGHIDAHGWTYRLELEACQVATGRVESLVREIDARQAAPQNRRDARAPPPSAGSRRRGPAVGPGLRTSPCCGRDHAPARARHHASAPSAACP